MPTRGGNATLDDYKAVLDELSEIIEKYRSVYDIIIGGDMNAYLHRSDRNITHDTAFTEFLEVNGLKLPDMCKKQSSFYHFNNRDKSQIDYFVENNLRVKKYLTFEREFTNLSTHDPIIVTVACKLQRIDINFQRHENIKVKWDKIDKEQNKLLLEENMKDVPQRVQTKDDKPQNIDNIITEFSNIMVKTAEQLLVLIIKP
jgi:ATP-dependent Lon protease